MVDLPGRERCGVRFDIEGGADVSEQHNEVDASGRDIRVVLALVVSMLMLALAARAVSRLMIREDSGNAATES